MQMIQEPTIRKLHHGIQLSLPDVQGDTGANFNATNNKLILWDYRRIDPMGISTYEGQSDKINALCAVGVGTMRIVLEGNGTINCSTLHIPQATGAIISPDKIMIEQKAASFIHEGYRNGQGKLLWKDEFDKIHL